MEATSPPAGRSSLPASACASACVPEQPSRRRVQAAIMQTIVSNPAKHPVFPPATTTPRSATRASPLQERAWRYDRSYVSRPVAQVRARPSSFRPTAHHLTRVRPNGSDDRFEDNPRRRARGRAGRHGSQRDERLGAQAVHPPVWLMTAGGLLHPQRRPTLSMITSPGGEAR